MAKKQWRRTLKDNPTPADLAFENIPYEPKTTTVPSSEKSEDKQEEEQYKSAVSRPYQTEISRNILDEIMEEDDSIEQADCEAQKPQTEPASRPNKRKSTSWKKSSVQSKMEKMA